MSFETRFEGEEDRTKPNRLPVNVQLPRDIAKGPNPFLDRDFPTFKK